MWAYLFFMMHLRNKDKSAYTAHESYVADMLSDPKRETKWFPVNRSLCLIANEEKGVWSLVFINRCYTR